MTNELFACDGRVDEEKMYELLAVGTETESLDYKATLNLSKTAEKSKVEFAKDCMAMMNLPDGGYLVVGVRKDGSPATDLAPIRADHFDSAALVQRVEKFVDSPLNITSAVHSHENGREIAVIYVHSTRSVYPAMAIQEGFYKDGERRNTVFRKGDILIREGTVNARVSLRTWPMALSKYREMIKAEAREDIDQLIHGVVEALRANGSGSRPVALTLDMEDESFTSSVEAAIDMENTTALKRFTTAARRDIRSTYKDPTGDARQTALDRLTEYVAVALENERDDLAQSGIETLYKAYLAPLEDQGIASTSMSRNVLETARFWLDFMVRIYALGALAVRLERWNFLRPLVLRKVGDETYHYVSWLRHGMVEAARAELLSRKGDTEPRAGAVISLGLELCTRIAALRPDIDFDPEENQQILPSQVLDSLCQFDLLYCLIVASASENQGFGYDFYPASVSFKQDRVDAILQRLATDAGMRDALFPEDPGATLAGALTEVMEMAAKESGKSHSFWQGLRGAAYRYVENLAP